MNAPVAGSLWMSAPAANITTSAPMARTGKKRFIEVKERAATGPIVLTGPEVDKLRQLGPRAWLYVVTFCREDTPRLHIIQDPITRLHPEMLYRQVQFLVQEDDWSQSVEVVETT